MHRFSTEHKDKMVEAVLSTEQHEQKILMQIDYNKIKLA
jgi:hypothetical protein